MLRSVNYRVRSEPAAWQVAGGRYHPGRQVIIVRRGSRLILPIGAGAADDVSVYRESDGGYVVVVVNDRYGYAGVEAFDADGAPVADVFCQSDEELRGLIGPKGTDYTPRTIARRLGEYL